MKEYSTRRRMERVEQISGEQERKVEWMKNGIIVSGERTRIQTFIGGGGGGGN